MDGNLCQIQSGPKTGDSIPLILFHDAGGTIFQYLLLEDLQRPVYGMANSRFESGGNWDHGIREMGVVYAHKIRSVINSGKVILGGLAPVPKHERLGLRILSHRMVPRRMCRTGGRFAAGPASTIFSGGDHHDR